MNRSLATHPLFVAAVWLVAYCTSSAITLQNLLGEIAPAALQVHAKLMAYIGAAANAGFTLASVTVCGFACGLMLRWLGETIAAKTIARRVAGAFWVLAAYAWFMVALVASQPPRSLSLEELLASNGASIDLDELLGFPWLTEAQYVSMALFPVVLFLLLARRCAWVNALIAVAFATATVSLISVAILHLTTLHQG